jgi:DNA-binding protein HU-beta
MQIPLASMRFLVAHTECYVYIQSQFQSVNKSHNTRSENMPKATPKTKAQIIAKLAEDVNLSKKDAAAALESIVQMAYKGAKSKDGFTIPGIGKLIKQRRKARMGRNPATGETIKIKAKTVLKFRIAKAAKDAII